MSKSEGFKYLFGPILSRRLGRSLGIDVINHKICSLDCIYCQIGRTTSKTIVRTDSVPLEDVVSELREWIGGGGSSDYITLSGSGEPTLYSRIGDLVGEIKTLTNTPIAVLTNGTLFWDKAVRDACKEADLVIPSLDAGDEETFLSVNRPEKSLQFSKVIEGLVQFRSEYKGKIWLEVFLVDGINSSEEQVNKIAAIAKVCLPDKIQLNTVTRPPAEKSAIPVERDKLNALCSLFTPKAEVIVPFEATRDKQINETNKERILAVIRRHPCTLDDLATGLESDRALAEKYIEDLVNDGLIRRESDGDRIQYTIKTA